MQHTNESQSVSSHHEHYGSSTEHFGNRHGHYGRFIEQGKSQDSGANICVFVVLQQKTRFFLRKTRFPSCTAGQSPSSSLPLSPLTTATARCELRAAIEHTNTVHGRSLLAAHFATPRLHARTHARARTTDDERRDVRRSAGVADWTTARRGNTERTLTATAGSSPCDPYRHAIARWPSQKVRPFVS